MLVTEEEQNCPFCFVPRERILLEYPLAYAVRDLRPVTHLHSLIIPRRHVVDYFGLNEEEILCCNDILRELRNGILAEDETVKGFNIGMNAGAIAGQTVFHCHIHLIARRKGDVPDPKGGITTPAWKPVVSALEHLEKGGRLVINAIRKEEKDKSVLLTVEYHRHLWLEKEIKTVANVTRADIRECLDLAARMNLHPEFQEFSLRDANRALEELKERHIRGAKILRMGNK